MKNIAACFIVSIFFLFESNYANSQFYINASAGNAIPALKQMVGTNNYHTQAMYNRTSFDRGIFHSYGGGFSPCVVAGIKIGKHFSAELGYSYLFGAKKSFTSYYSDLHHGSRSYQNITNSIQMHRIQPGIRFSFLKNKFEFYNSLRIIIGVGGKFKMSLSYNYADSTSTAYHEGSGVYYGGLSTGFSNSLGTVYSLGKFGVFMEINFICQSWAPKKGNGVEFTNPVGDPSPNPDLAAPMQLLKQYYPLSSAGISIGLTYTFNKK